ncbi:DNA gyrase/topoisomerase IV subunit A [Microscilla marina]|uniref:Topoisomerase IV subunit A n=1 Tax=Microscilla marina ATCC 23134 TaxID=313606 RepID=A1ZXC5_MICM2|nr:DNA gyrase/topoisomerase IV subunit A [Microscilla marina]EAY24998.1 topoisomerase IV subunit A [Microscilla marina ATCC 23134]
MASQENKVTISEVYKDWFLDYASYVILERAVPSGYDGLKPVQRRILHAMKEMDDGRYNKVANVIGQAMQYHPHGDASIGDALVNMGQKDLLVDTQGNWGDINTGDSAAAPRYIEGRLSKFALDVIFNPQTTEWQLSYDGRKKEPVNLPVKFPLLLAQGTEGIAVGLATKVMPHNFNELIDASIELLRGNEVTIYPDFATGGTMDVTNYRHGVKGGRLRVRVDIEQVSRKILAIKNVPYGVTTENLIESIKKANDANKIKVKKIIDNTAKDVEIQVHLSTGVEPEQTIDALYAFTNCEVSISPNACVILDDKPCFIKVEELLKINTQKTKDLLEQELLIRKSELQEKMLYSSLEKIFIENRIYRDIEECETWEAVLETIDKGLNPFKQDFYREIGEEDLIRLTEIKIKRISKFDSFKADELMKRLGDELAEVERNLKSLTKYAIRYFRELKKKYGKDRERRTIIQEFEDINAKDVVINNQKLYVNREDGFIGYGLKKDEYVVDCSDIDEVITFCEDGKYKIVKIAPKVFIGKNIIHVAVFDKSDKNLVYNAIYRDGVSGRAMAKRFQVKAVIRDREYDVTKGTPRSKLLYFSINPKGETEEVSVRLTRASKAKNKLITYDFAEIDVKGKSAQGNIVTKHPVQKVNKSKSNTVRVEKPKSPDLFD